MSISFSYNKQFELGRFQIAMFITYISQGDQNVFSQHIKKLWGSIRRI